VAKVEYRMPELGEGLHEGEIVKWHVQPGDTVQEDDVLMEVQNDKAVVEVPSPVSGRVVELLVKEGTVAVVGDVLAVFETDGEGEEKGGQQQEPAEPAADKGAPPVSPQHAPAGGAAAPDRAAPAAEGRPASAAAAADAREGARLVLATPGVRKLARELGVPIARVKGTGRNGRITREDVLAYAEGGPKPETEARTHDGETAPSPAASGKDTPPRTSEAAADEERVPLKGIRRAIANAMVKSVYTAPHVTIMDEADVSKLVALRQKAKPLAEQKGVKLTYLPFVVKALVAAVREFPALNASIDDERGEIVYKKRYHVGIATDTEGGLLVPVVKDADRKNIWTIAREIADLAVRAREGKLAPEEMRGSTISISNIGSAGGMFFTPVINWPEVAILGTGRITEKPVVRGGAIEIGQLMALSLSFDHRLIDGATAQQAMNLIKRLLEDPEMLVMEV